MKVIEQGLTLEALHEEVMPARGAKCKVRRADERWEKPDFVEAWHNLTTVHHNLVRFEGGLP